MSPTAKLTLLTALCVLTLPDGSRWLQQDHLFANDAMASDAFGRVAIDGDTIVVGANLDDTAAGNLAGSAYVFTRTGVAWSQQDHLFASDAAAGDNFGESVAISGDTIVVGAPSDHTVGGADAGSAYVFTRTGGTWSQQDHLFASDAAADDKFGYSVAIDGDTIVVGAWGDDTAAASNSGSAYVFTRTAGTWTEEDHLVASDAAEFDFFGRVSIDGNTIVVGANGDDTAAGSLAGSIYVFTRSGVTWSEQDHLYANDAAAGDQFGLDVAISGETVVAGAPLDDVVGKADAGSAYVFTRAGTTWSQQDHLFPDDVAWGHRFGSSVSIDGNNILAGVPEPNDVVAGGPLAGSAIVFTRIGSSWSQQDHVFADDPSEGDWFGFSVAIDGDTAVVGAQNDDTAVGPNAGSACVYVLRYLSFHVLD